jgi:hypothetical protein
MAIVAALLGKPLLLLLSFAASLIGGAHVATGGHHPLGILSGFGGLVALVPGMFAQFKTTGLLPALKELPWTDLAKRLLAGGDTGGVVPIGQGGGGPQPPMPPAPDSGYIQAWAWINPYNPNFEIVQTFQLQYVSGELVWVAISPPITRPRILPMSRMPQMY